MDIIFARHPDARHARLTAPMPFFDWLRDAAELLDQREMPQPAEQACWDAWAGGQTPQAFVARICQ